MGFRITYKMMAYYETIDEDKKGEFINFLHPLLFPEDMKKEKKERLLFNLSVFSKIINKKILYDDLLKKLSEQKNKDKESSEQKNEDEAKIRHYAALSDKLLTNGNKKEVARFLNQQRTANPDKEEQFKEIDKFYEEAQPSALARFSARISSKIIYCFGATSALISPAFLFVGIIWIATSLPHVETVSFLFWTIGHVFVPLYVPFFCLRNHSCCHWTCNNRCFWGSLSDKKST